MRLRRKRILSVLRPGEVAPTMTCFPLMGVGDFVSPPDAATAATDSHLDAHKAEVDIKMPSEPAALSRLGGHGGDPSKWHVRGPVANSAYIPDAIINPHPRFGALTKNIRVSCNCKAQTYSMTRGTHSPTRDMALGAVCFSQGLPREALQHEHPAAALRYESVCLLPPVFHACGISCFLACALYILARFRIRPTRRLTTWHTFTT